MNTAHNKWLTLAFGLVLAGGTLFWPPGSPAEDPPRPAVTQGRLQGRFTAADTGEPVAGAKLQVFIQGVPGKPKLAEGVSGPDGSYKLDMPLGHIHLWGVHAPAGYYTHDPQTRGAIVTTAAKPAAIRDFVLQPGSAWHVEVQGVTVREDKPPQFSAWPNPDPDFERQHFVTEEIIHATCDARGKAVLTVPSSTGRYHFKCSPMSSPSIYEIPFAVVKMDKDFDPQKIKGGPEPVAEVRGSVRLRDTAGRTAVVEGVDVLVEGGQAVLRFPAKKTPTDEALVLRGAAVDEAGKPIKGAKFTAAISQVYARPGRGPGPSALGGAFMTHLEATTDAQGKFELPGVLLPPTWFQPEYKIQMLAVKSGFDGAQTEKLSLVDVRKAGSGDFGTVVLRPGHTLRGKVVDENGTPVHGALIINHTDYFLYGHLACRTDAKGQFVMPDLRLGPHKIWAAYGERSGQGDFDFDATSGESVISVRLTPKDGRRRAPAKLPPLPPAPRPQPDLPKGAWDLSPPKTEPKYQKEPRYALLAFGPKREARVWMVLDGTTLYVDRNANGDLTEPEERLEPANPKDGSNKFGNPGMYTRNDHFEFAVAAGIGGSSKFKLHRWVRAEAYEPQTEFEKGLRAKWLKHRWENSTLWRQGGVGQGQTPVLFMPKPADAQVCHLDGPLTFVLKSPEDQVLQRGEAGCDVPFHIAVIGRSPTGTERQFYNSLATKEAPEAAHLMVEIEYPAKGANDPPLRRKYFLKERC